MNVGAKRIVRTVLTLAVLATSWLVAFLVRYEFSLPDVAVTTFAVTLVPILALKLGLLSYLRVNRHSWQHVSLGDVLSIGAAMFAAGTFLGAARTLLPLVRDAAVLQYLVVPYGIILIDFALSTLGLVGIRVARRLQSDRTHTRRIQGAERTRRVLIVGAGRAGGMVAREIAARPDIGLRPVGFLDDDPAKRNLLIHGLEVLGGSADLADVVRDRGVDEVIIAIASADGTAIRTLSERCRDAGVEARIVPGVYEILGGKVNLSRLRPVRIEDLLRRAPVDLDVSTIRDAVTGKTVVVTGAGGSIGSELCRQLLPFAPATLVLVDRGENSLWAIHRELDAQGTVTSLVPAIADVCDRDRMDQLFAEHAPVAVFHAAAHKHVPMMESNPGEAVKNNVHGTKQTADLALAHGVERFVLISTDKAVNPTSIMGMTKRVAERYVQHLARQTGRNFVSVRFGNVLGSAGSVVPIFEQQIAAGGPITITDPDMRRYFMTIPEASQLVIQAAALGDGGEIFVLDMGEPVRIVDLARDLIHLSGLTPDDDIAIEFTGIRPGEKLFEELGVDTEHTDRTKHPKIFTGTNPEPTWTTVDDDLAHLLHLIEQGDLRGVRTTLRQHVPELRGSGDPALGPAVVEPTPR